MDAESPRIFPGLDVAESFGAVRGAGPGTAAVLGEVKLRIDAGKVTGIEGRGRVLWEDQYRPDPERLYRVATHSGMLAGVHRYETFARGQDIERSDRQVNEIVEAAFRSMDKISAPKVGAVTLIKAEK